MTPSQQLIKRLRDCGLSLPEDTELRRIYAGWAMKARGCWSWFAWSPTKDVNVGSHYTVTSLLRDKKLSINVNEFGETEIDPA